MQSSDLVPASDSKLAQSDFDASLWAFHCLPLFVRCQHSSVNVQNSLFPLFFFNSGRLCFIVYFVGIWQTFVLLQDKFNLFLHDSSTTDNKVKDCSLFFSIFWAFMCSL